MARFSTSGISRVSAERRWYVIAAWIVALLIGGALSTMYLDDALTTDFTSSSNQDSVVGLQLLEDRMQYPDPETETIVVESSSITVEDPGFASTGKRSGGGSARIRHTGRSGRRNQLL